MDEIKLKVPLWFHSILLSSELLSKPRKFFRARYVCHDFAAHSYKYLDFVTGYMFGILSRKIRFVFVQIILSPRPAHGFPATGWWRPTECIGLPKLPLFVCNVISTFCSPRPTPRRRSLWNSYDIYRKNCDISLPSPHFFHQKLVGR